DREVNLDWIDCRNSCQRSTGSVDKVTDLGLGDADDAIDGSQDFRKAQIQHRTIRSRFGILELSLGSCDSGLGIADQRFLMGHLSSCRFYSCPCDINLCLRNGIRLHCIVVFLLRHCFLIKKWTIFINVELRLDLICFRLRQLCLGLRKLTVRLCFLRFSLSNLRKSLFELTLKL